MLNAIETIFNQAATAMGAVQRFAGVVVPVRKVTGTADQGLAEGIYPVGCVASGECSETAKLNYVTPDESLTGVAYVEQRGAPAIANADNLFRMTYPVRFVAWLNMGKLGYTVCTTTHLFELAALKCLKQQDTVSVSGFDDPVQVQIGNFRMAVKEPGNIFRNYVFADNMALYFWPFDYFAIDADVTFYIPRHCIPAIDLPVTVECIAY